MKRSFMAIALLACAALASTCYHAVADPIVSAYRMVTGFALDAFKLAGGGSACIDLNPVSIRLKFKAFVQRIEKRERPVVMSSWRMCPSI